MCYPEVHGGCGPFERARSDRTFGLFPLERAETWSHRADSGSKRAALNAILGIRSAQRGVSGVGGSGRRPLESADPRVRRAGMLRKNGFKRTVYSKNSLVKYSRGRGAGGENRSPRGPRGGAVRCSGLARIALLGFSRSNGRKGGHVEPIQGPNVVH